MPVPWQKNTIVIGDAAAFVEVETQGALMCGYRAANAVAKELSGERGFDAYTKWWKDSFEFNSSDVMRVAQGFALVPKYTDEELDYLFGLVEGERLEGTYNQYRSPKIMWDAIMNHSDKIKSERSELFEKITGSQSCLSDML
jgi:flavin-dependent dehydrogenase